MLTIDEHALLSPAMICFMEVYLPPVYVVRREGNVLTRVCLSVHRGVGQSGGGISPAGGGSVQWGGVSPAGGGQSAGGGQPGGWSAKIGQQNEYSLHSGRYASCVHAGGLSCLKCPFGWLTSQISIHIIVVQTHAFSLPLQNCNV